MDSHISMRLIKKIRSFELEAIESTEIAALIKYDNNCSYVTELACNQLFMGIKSLLILSSKIIKPNKFIHYNDGVDADEKTGIIKNVVRFFDH